MKTCIFAMFLVLCFSASADGGFMCEKIKDKSVRNSCIKDRTEKTKTASENTAKLEEQKKAQVELDEFVKKSKRELTKGFKDPNSAEYMDLVVIDSGPLKTLCGSVNAKNSYGAYVGFERFYVRWLDGVPSLSTELNIKPLEAKYEKDPSLIALHSKELILATEIYNHECTGLSISTVTSVK